MEGPHHTDAVRQAGTIADGDLDVPDLDKPVEEIIEALEERAKELNCLYKIEELTLRTRLPTPSKASCRRFHRDGRPAAWITRVRVSVHSGSPSRGGHHAHHTLPHPFFPTPGSTTGGPATAGSWKNSCDAWLS